MRILMISDVYFPRVNGVSTSIQTFRRALDALGHRVDLIAPEYNGPRIEESGISRIPSRYLPLDPEDRIMKAGKIRALRPQLRECGYDLVHVQTPFVAHYLGIEIADALGVPRIETYHTFFEEYLFHYVPFVPKRVLRAASRRLSRAQCNQMDALIVPSMAMGEVLARYGVRVPVHVIPTGIPLGDFAAGNGMVFRNKWRIPTERPVLLYVGRVAFEKNIDFLMRALQRALARMPELLLVIAGEGPASASLKRRAARWRLQEHVVFVGYLERSVELLDCYRAADAFVFASRTETQGLVLLEALALGVPVISTAVMGTRDIVGPRRGAVVPADDETAFADAIVAVMRDAGWRARLADEGRAYAREWKAEPLARKLAAVYESVAARRASPEPVSCPL